MFISQELLEKALLPFGLRLTQDEIGQFDQYAKMLVAYNEKVNLTAITQPDDIVIKHFADSLALLHYCSIKQNAMLADVGTGAGFPGVTLMIARRDIDVRLFDATKKKLVFIDSVISELGLNGKTVHMRAEEAGQSSLYRERFDFVTARAVAELRILSELCVPLLKVNGEFAPMKAGIAEEELQSGKKALAILGAQVKDIKTYNLYTSDTRTILIAKKISQTLTKYPRSFSQITKNLL